MRFDLVGIVALVSACVGCTTLLPGDVPNLPDAASSDAGTDATVPPNDGGDMDAGDEVDAGRLPDAAIVDADVDADVDAGRGTDAGMDAGADAGPPYSGPIVHDVAVGGGHACAVVGDDRVVQCWGALLDGATGVPDDDSGPVSPTPVPWVVDARSLCAGEAFTCAVVERSPERRAVLCWGRNSAGQLGTGSTGPTTHVPQELTIDAETVACGTRHACAVTRSGHAYCWGANGQRQSSFLTNPVVVPTQVRMAGETPVALTDVLSLTLGRDHSCAHTDRVSADNVYCWGSNAEGQALHLTASTLEHATLVAPSTQVVAAAHLHTCAWVEGAGVTCAGQLLAGPVVARPAVPLEPALVAGADFDCALAAGELTCWGESNAAGQLTGLPGTSLVRTVPLEGVVRAAAGPKTACAIVDSGELFCWGDNGEAQIGPRSIGTEVRVPHPIAFPPP